MSINVRNLCFSLAVSTLALIPAAIAATVCEAMEYYKKKDYIHANKLFEKATEENPKDWKSHYYLGNCLYAMGRYSSAVYHYELAAKMAHNGHDVHLCQMAAYKAEASGLKSRVAMTHLRTQAENAQYLRDVDMTKRKNQIMSQADSQAQQIKSKAEAQIKSERDASQTRWTDSKGEMKLDITRDRINQINQEAVNQMEYVKEQAQNKVDNIK